MDGKMGNVRGQGLGCCVPPAFLSQALRHRLSSGWSVPS